MHDVGCRDEFERDRRQGQDHRGEGMGATGQRGVWIRDRGARSGDSGTDELLRERQVSRCRPQEYDLHQGSHFLCVDIDKLCLSTLLRVCVTFLRSLFTLPKLSRSSPNSPAPTCIFQKCAPSNILCMPECVRVSTRKDCTDDVSPITTSALFLLQRAHVEQLKATEIACTKANSTLRVSKEVVQSLQGYWISVTNGGAPSSIVEQQHTPRNLEVLTARFIQISAECARVKVNQLCCRSRGTEPLLDLPMILIK